MKNILYIFDTTLRDGEQSPGASMTEDEKLRIARQLERLKVDIIEAGFPAASPGDFQAVSKIANSISESTVCALARANEKDIQAAADSLKNAKRKRIHTFIASSPIHMERKLKMSADQVIERATNAVKLARNFTDDVEFSPEDAGRSEFDFLVRLCNSAIFAGATTINIPDTVGYNLPLQFGDLIAKLIANVDGADKIIWSTHCHDDLGLAVANSLSGVINGARQVECTINGLGERAGNASLEEVVMTIRTRPDYFNCNTQIDTTQLVPASRLVSSITGFPVQPNKAIVGANAFAHTSGIHQDGVIKYRQTYEIMTAEDVGWSSNKLVLGKLSGRNAFQTRLVELGIDIKNWSDDKLSNIFASFKDLADRKDEVFDDDLIALISEEEHNISLEKYQLVDISYSALNNNSPTAELKIKVEDEIFDTKSEGSGPVDAIFKAIEKIVASHANLLLFSVNNVTTGTDAQGEVTVRLSKNGVVVNGQGAHTDIVVASAKAYINALNRMSHQTKRIRSQV